MNKKILSLGSVVILNNGEIPVMIVLRQPIVNINDRVEYFDYVGINQVFGLDPEKLIYFNQENIDEVLFEGYIGEYEERILESLNEWVQVHPEIEKGKV